MHERHALILAGTGEAEPTDHEQRVDIVLFGFEEMVFHLLGDRHGPVFNRAGRKVEEGVQAPLVLGRQKARGQE